MALLPPFYLHTVAAIGVGEDPSTRAWIGTGFLFGNLVVPQPSNQDGKVYRIWLITNKHVLRGLKGIYVKFNSAVDPHSKDYAIPLISRNGKPYWVGHNNPDTDVAAVSVPVKLLEHEKRLFSYFRSDDHVSTVAQMRDNQITEGDRVFVLGFPMGLVEPSRQYVICRAGAIARVRDCLEGNVRDYLVDATVFPGNSGGPVVLCPAALAIQGTKPISKADLIGVVKSYVPYKDMAISSQTRQPRIIFEENSGLAAVETADAILETVALAERRLKSRLARSQRRERKQTSVATIPAVPGEPLPSGESPPDGQPARIGTRRGA